MPTMEPTPAQQAAWDQYQQARRDAGLPVVVDIQAADLRRDDALPSGGTLTSDPVVLGGNVVVEVDYRTLATWPGDTLVPIYEREADRG